MRKLVFLFVAFFMVSCIVFAQECAPDKTRRSEVMNTLDSPYKYIMQLSVKRQRGTYKATGFLIAPRVILTAAHNIHRFHMFSFPKQITVIPGANYANHDKTPFGKFTYGKNSLGLITHPDYTGNATRKSDFGVIILPNDSIFNRLGGFLRFDVFDDVKNEIDSLIISGYPGDQPYGTQWTEKTIQYQEKSGMLIYGLFTHTGLSGAPVFYKKPRQNEYVVVGIHNSGKLNGTKTCNAATKIDSEVEDIIIDWLKKFGHLLND